MVDWLPAKIRIEYYQNNSAHLYKRSRECRNAKKLELAQIYRDQAKIDAARGRNMLLNLVKHGHPASYTGDL